MPTNKFWERYYREKQERRERDLEIARNLMNPTMPQTDETRNWVLGRILARLVELEKS